MNKLSINYYIKCLRKLVSERKNDFEESSQFIKGLTDNLK
jgi:hypothetical protein